MKQDPAPDARCKDKFLVQSIEIAPESGVPTVGAHLLIATVVLMLIVV